MTWWITWIGTTSTRLPARCTSKESGQGDILRIDLLNMEVGQQSSMVTIPGEGALGDVIDKMETTILKLDGKEIVYKDRIRVPIKPMIGVIGVAPQSGKVATGTPGPHGGNMDCTLIGAGSRVYFTAGVDGALFGAGDFHAAMGDGEIVVCGAETSGELRFKAQVVDLPGLPTPFVETSELVATIFSAVTVDEAADGAIHRMAQFLTGLAGIPLNDAGMLMSLVGAAEILPGGRSAEDRALRISEKSAGGLRV